MELIVVIAAVAALSIIFLLSASPIRARGQRAQCTANLRNLYVATEAYIQQNGSWPQISEGDSDSAELDYATAWIAALKPFGPTAKTWICPTVQELMRNPDYTRPENARLDYVATPFDDKQLTPHQWPRQPWFAEVGDVHGNGNLIVFTDGSVSDLNTVMKGAASTASAPRSNLPPAGVPPVAPPMTPTPSPTPTPTPTPSAP